MKLVVGLRASLIKKLYHFPYIYLMRRGDITCKIAIQQLMGLIQPEWIQIVVQLAAEILRQRNSYSLRQKVKRER